MFYVFRLATTLSPQGRTAMIMGTMLSYLIGKSLSDALIRNVTDAQKSSGSVAGAAALSVADTVLPIRSGYEAITGKSFYPTDPEHPYLNTRDRSMAVGSTAGGAVLATLGGAFWLAGRPNRGTAGSGGLVPPPAGGNGGTAGTFVSVADHGDFATVLGQITRAHESGRNPPHRSFSYGVAAEAETLALSMHGQLARNARGSSRGAMGVALSKFLTHKLGLARPDGTMMSPEMLAMYTVYYLKFRGTFIHLDACGTGYYSSFLDQSFIEAYAQVLAQYLKHPVTVEGPRGLLYSTGSTSWVQPNTQTPALPPGDAFSTVTAK